MALKPYLSAGVLLMALLLCSGPAQDAYARSHNDPAFTGFKRAEKQREALEGRPLRERSRAAYDRVLDAFRAIYHNEPHGEQADAAVDAVAGLLAEEGRAFHDEKLLRAALDQYEFLRRVYPSSPFRQSALLNEAEIAQSDLQDGDAARQSFTEFLRLYPRSPLAGEARQQLKALGRPEPVPALAGAGTSTAPQVETTKQRAARNAADHARELAELNGAKSAPSVAKIPGSAKALPASVPPVPVSSAQTATPAGTQVSLTRAASTRPVYITGIRHWSTPIYTRVAIDLSDQVRYEAARVPDPDRIYFDLHGTRLAPELVGKSVDVTQDGFLQRVRIAPSPGDVTRVVLDVSHVSEYSAFFLPNPWRLIIDIHGSRGPGPMPADARTDAVTATSSRETANSTAANTVAGKAASSSSSLREVATLGQQPHRVKATTHATTAPIAASVRGTTRAQQPNELEALAAPPLASMPAGALAGSSASAPASVVNAPASTTRVRRKSVSPLSVTTPVTASGTASVKATTVPTNLTPETLALGAREATPTSTGERSLVRALGLKIGRIVIDAGHGGHDSGTLGPAGLEEKDVVLDVALRLGKLLKQKLGADVIYTRDDDTFIPLETRTAIANKAQADLFISVHANSSSDPAARGVEVYYLNFTTSPEALEVAARENAVSDQSIYQLSDLVKKITLKDKIDESHEFAADVEGSLYSGLQAGNEGLKDRGVKKAPFVVLIGANMPSILAEISFLTNPEDARELRMPQYRERIAESLYAGVSRYVSGLSGVRLAQGAARTSTSGRN